MKKFNIISIIILAFGVALGSCTDDLDQMPVTETTSNDVYADAANYRSVLAKIYASYVLAGQGQGGDNGDLTTINGQDFSRGYFNLQEASTDEVANTWLSGNNLTDLTYITWNSKDSWVSDSYYWLFFNITLCNEFIRHCTDSEIAKFSSEDQANIRAYRTEARFMRAFSYWMVLDLFRQGPKVDENTPVSGFIPEAYNGVTLFDFIESELKALTDDNGADTALPATNEYGRASRPAALALLSRLYLNSAVYRGTVDNRYYTECIAACKKVLSNPSLRLEEDYAKLFNADNYKRTHEILFAMVCDATTSVTWGGGTYLVCGSCGNSSSQDPAKYGLTSGWGMFRARGELAEKFGDVNTTADSRAMFYTDGQAQYFTGAIDNQAEGYFFEKFSNLTDAGEAASNSAATGCSTDYPMLRLAEVYLTAAEAMLRGGSGLTRSEALDYVNAVRLRAYRQDPSGKIADADLTLDFILDERARELYLESVRRTDLVRFNRFTSDSYLWQWKGGVLDGRAVNDKFNIYPIPDTDLTANPNLSNPLY
ncbi:MAG: RagB/SusD family nutrient uptake outer membrane protein [Bacteroides sp.]|nr:RagB/SusD family nutrient uptake outer membrane protein [Bacteroides sp.]MCM1477365.1 RagB/SusD family nutrient uptake outer membrane protein [Bacteroides sp.]